MRQTLSLRIRRNADGLICVLLFLGTFALYLRTLAPSVAFLFDDSLEYQLAAPRMAIVHPTGYPLFSILIKIFTFLPVGDVAFRVNLVSALAGAAAVAIVYLAARQLVRSRAAALFGALLFAVGETFWSQAVVAESYTFQALLTAAMLWLALCWGLAHHPQAGSDTPRRAGAPSLVALAFFYGVMLTHHRMSALLFPALAVYILSYERAFLREPRTLFKMGAAFVLPLLLYLYIPLRGLTTSSLDGTYQNTPAGFLHWVLASSYTVFLTQNPFNQNRDAAYYFDLFVRNVTPVGLLLALAGFIELARRAWREWLLLALGLAANAAFAASYRVANVNLYFIPSFLFVALFVAGGVDALLRLASRAAARLPAVAPARAALAALLGLALLLLPFSLLRTNLPRVDLSAKWDVHDYGRDILSQPLPDNATLIGILGEMTLVRYFQETQGLRPDVQTVAADTEPARLAAIDAALKNKRTVFLTRPLAGVEKRYSLVSAGPLVEVEPRPNRTQAPAPGQSLDPPVDFDGVQLVGYDLDLARLNDADTWHLANGRRARVTLYWHVEKKIADDRFASLKLLAPDGTLGGQLDRRPVLDTYPTTAWRAGEFIADTYDLPVFAGAAPGNYALQVTLYDPDSGQVRGQKDLAGVALAPDTHDHYAGAEALSVDQPAFADFGALALAGYSFAAGDPYAPGDVVPLELLWRANAAGARGEFALTLVDAAGRAVLAQDLAAGSASLSAQQYARQSLSLTLPAGAGTYELRLAARTPAPLSLPFMPAYSVLGQIEVRPAQ